MRWKSTCLIGLTFSLLGFFSRESLQACSFCSGNVQRLTTLRQEAGQAKLVLIGTMTNPRLIGEGEKAIGVTDFMIETILRDHTVLIDHKKLTVSRYIPVDEKRPARFLLFCDVNQGKIDPYRGVPVHSEGLSKYLVTASALPVHDPVGLLKFYATHLNSDDPEISQDSFLEFAKTSDTHVEQIAKHLNPEVVRACLTNPKTPIERIGVFAYLLGLCGTAQDGESLRLRLESTDKTNHETFGGLLTGFVMLKPEAGWKWIQQRLDRADSSVADKLAIVGTLRYFQVKGGKPARDKIMILYRSLLSDRNLCDLVIEDLRRWGWYDLTPPILALYDQPMYTAPIVRNGILRYALCCPNPEAASFITDQRKKFPDVIRDLEESIAFERQAAPKIP